MKIGGNSKIRTLTLKGLNMNSPECQLLPELTFGVIHV